jgi:hypothetical protein
MISRDMWITGKEFLAVFENIKPGQNNGDQADCEEDP